jgi:hypothetical protein
MSRRDEVSGELDNWIMKRIKGIVKSEKPWWFGNVNMY